jgi:hypothetical protein
MSDSLEHVLLSRLGSSTPDGVSVQARISADFIVNGNSLLQVLVKEGGGHSDFMGRFVTGYPDVNKAALSELLCRSSPAIEGGRTLLYLCPECGDIGCGAYAARVVRAGEAYMWLDFAYVNGYEPPQSIAGIGPFTFPTSEYEHAVETASAL